MLVLILDVQLNPDYMCQEEAKKRVVIISVNSDGSVYEQLLKHCEDLNIAFTELQEVMEKNQPKVQTLSGIIDLAKIIANQFKPDFREKISTPKAFGQSKMKIKKYK